MAVRSEVDGPRTFLRLFVLRWPYYEVWFCMENCILGRDWVAVVRIIEVTALWIKQYIVYVRWAFGTSSTGRIKLADRLNEVTIDWGSTVFNSSSTASLYSFSQYHPTLVTSATTSNKTKTLMNLLLDVDWLEELRIYLYFKNNIVATDVPFHA